MKKKMMSLLEVYPPGIQQKDPAVDEKQLLEFLKTRFLMDEQEAFGALNYATQFPTEPGTISRFIMIFKRAILSAGAYFQVRDGNFNSPDYKAFNQKINEAGEKLEKAVVGSRQNQ